MNSVMEWYSGLQAREQRMVLIGAPVVVLLILVGGVLLPLESAVSRALQTEQSRRDDLAWMRLNAPEIRGAGASLAPDTGEAPMVLVDRIGRF